MSLEDPDIANWILEFFIRQPLEDRTLKSMLRALPPSSDNPNLKKWFLLKKLESETSRNSVSITTLELLELLEEREFLQGNENVSDTMKKAYCCAAVEYTAKNLGAGDGNNEGNRFNFFEAVRRVWKGKIGRMRKHVEKGGLGSEELWAWKDEIEKALWEDDVVSGSIVKKCGEVNGVEAVRAYIREEKEKMGPSFLELVAERVKDDEVLQGILGLNGNGIDLAAGKEASPSCLNASKEDNHASIPEFAQAPGGNTSDVPRRPSLMECNNRARTCESDESIDGSQEGRASRGRPRLPSPRPINTSPLNRYQPLNLMKRRTPRKWSLLDEDALANAVDKYGTGQWKLILALNRDTFAGRTEVDLKDKWRNMRRYRGSGET